ncbi:MAG: metallophosphoesterase family protein [Methanobacteriaceae archaeon]
MKILAISDLHSGEIVESVISLVKDNNVDIIAISGDITDFGTSDEAENTLNNIAESGAELIAIPGNCDSKDICSAIDKSNAFNCHNNIYDNENLAICGFGGSNPTPFNTPFEFSEDEIYSNIKELTINFSKSVETSKFKILLTHAPPINTNADKIGSGDHVGSSSVRKIIEEFQPDLAICGHIHEAKSSDKIGKTTIINPGMANSGDACLITIESNGIESNFINFIN